MCDVSVLMLLVLGWRVMKRYAWGTAGGDRLESHGAVCMGGGDRAVFHVAL